MPDDRFKVVAGPDQPVADNLAITQCLNQYCHLVDRGSVDEIVALFADDALLRTPYQNTGEFEENYPRVQLVFTLCFNI